MSKKRPTTADTTPGPLAKEPSVLLESTLPPTPMNEMLAAEGAAIAVLSVDGTLIETVHQAGGNQYPIVVTATWQELLNQIERRRCGIVVLDVDSVSDMLERRVAELRGVMPNLVVLVASPRKEAEALVGLLSDRKIHRLLMKPPALGITRLLLESAVSRWLEQRDYAPPGSDATREVEVFGSHAGGRRAGRWALAAAAVAVLGGVAGWWFYSPNESPPPVVVAPARRPAAAPAAAVAPADTNRAPTASSAAAGAPDPLIEGLLERARAATSEGRLDAPPGDNALDHYLAVLRIEPAHPDAGREVDRLLEGTFGQAEEALLAGAIEDAAVILERVRRVRPDGSRLRFLDAQLRQAMAQRDEAAARAERQAAQARAAATAPPSEVASLLTLAEARLRRGQLLQPAGDSAKVYVDRAAALAPQDAAVAAMRADLAEALLASAQAITGLGETERAQSLLSEAEAFGANPAAIAALRSDLADIEATARLAQLAAWRDAGLDRLDRGQLIQPAEDSALYYLGRARALSPADPGLAAPWQRLMSALSAEARAAIDEQRWPDAERWIQIVQGADPADPAAAVLARELTVARRQAAYLGTAVPAAELTLLSGDPPAYPDAALRNNIEGWVEIEFVVGRDGQPRDITVLGADPPGRFEDAALASAASYRFAPFTEDGVVYERRASVRIRFALQ